MCLVGANGAGKSTLFSILTGLIRPQRGLILIDGQEVTSIDKFSQKVGFCSQFDVLWSQLSVKEHLQLFMRIKSIKPSRKLVSDSLHLANLYELRERQVVTLSGGQKRRLSILLASLGDPSIICLDEPTTGLDPVNRRLIWGLIRQLKEERMILMSTHSMEEAEMLSNRVGVMKSGKFVGIGSFAELKKEFGKELTVTLLSQAGKEEEAERVIRSYLSEECIVSKNAGSFLLSLNLEDLKKFPKLFEIIKGNCEEVFKESGIRSPTLEGLYLELN